MTISISNHTLGVKPHQSNHGTKEKAWSNTRMKKQACWEKSIVLGRKRDHHSH